MKKKLIVVSTVCVILMLLMAMTPAAALAANQYYGLAYQMEYNGPRNGGSDNPHYYYSSGPCHRYGIFILP